MPASQVARPRRWILLLLLSLAPALLLASRLEVRSSLESLLPEDKPSVRELERLEGRIGHMGTLIVVLEGAAPPSYPEILERLTPRIAHLGRDWVSGVSDGMRGLKEFARDHWWLYVDAEQLREVRDALTEVRDREILKRSGLDLELDDEADPPAALDIEQLKARLHVDQHRARAASLPDHYVSANGDFAAILVRTPFGSGDPRVASLQRKITELADEVAEELGENVRLGFTGSLVTSEEEHRATVRDLTHVGAVGVLLILGLVFSYFWRLRALLAVGLTVAVGCTWTFALAELFIGYLNPASGFMATIVAGNGINFAIIYMARYLEGRLTEQLTVAEATARAFGDTWAGTLTAAAAAAVAYGSLAVTQFPGFRQFGLIGSMGMLCCWVATYLFLPPMLVISEQLAPVRQRPRSFRDSVQWLFAGPLFAAARRAPRAVSLIGVLVVAAAGAAGTAYLTDDPMEYDLTQIRNDDADPRSARALGRRVASVMGRFSRDGRALVVDRLDQLAPLVSALEHRRRQAPRTEKPFAAVISILNLAPADQQIRVSLGREIARLVRQARRWGRIDDTTWQRLEPLVANDPRPVGIDDLPSELAWPFEEADGTRGKVVYLVPESGRSLNDARYLMSWADSFREITLPSGDVIYGSGEPVIFADVLQALRQEAPRAVAASLLGTIGVILLAFRLRGTGWLALLSVLAGTAALLGVLVLAGMKLNFLNFMALPITIGVGADYAVNVLRRYEVSPDQRLERAFRRTGGAVVLCSLTTAVGYGALLTSVNGAVRSFGFAAAAGELAMLLCAALLLPALLTWRDRRQRRALFALRRPSGAS